MNCPKCGNFVMKGTSKCICCGTPINSKGEDSAYQQTQGSKARRAQPSESLLTAFSNLPQMLKQSLRDPGELLRNLVIARDYRTSVIVLILSLLGAFLCGICCCQGIISGIFSTLSILLGAKANTATPQGISYIAGLVRFPCGGTMILCQALTVLITTIVYNVYICRFCHVQFTFELAVNFAGVIYLVLVPCELLAIVFSLWTPIVSLFFLILALAVSHVQACSMLSPITSLPDQRLFRGKLCCVGISLLITFIIYLLIGPALLNTSWRRIIVVISGMIGGL